MEMKPKNRPMLRTGQTPPARPTLSTSSAQPSRPRAGTMGGCKSCRGRK